MKTNKIDTNLMDFKNHIIISKILKLFDLKERRVISRFYELLSQTLDRSMEQKKKK